MRNTEVQPTRWVAPTTVMAARIGPAQGTKRAPRPTLRRSRSQSRSAAGRGSGRTDARTAPPGGAPESRGRPRRAPQCPVLMKEVLGKGQQRQQLRSGQDQEAETEYQPGDHRHGPEPGGASRTSVCQLAGTGHQDHGKDRKDARRYPLRLFGNKTNRNEFGHRAVPTSTTCGSGCRRTRRAAAARDGSRRGSGYEAWSASLACSRLRSPFDRP